MSSIYVQGSWVREANCDLVHLEAGAEMIRRGIQRTKKDIPDSIASQYQIGQRLKDVCREIDKLGERINHLHEIVNICMEQYRETEKENTRNAEAFL